MRLGRPAGNTDHRPDYDAGVLRSINVIRRSFPHRPIFDTAVSHALLRGASRGEVGETLRVHTSARMVAFGRQDVTSAGYGDAAVAARAAGFAAVERIAGGRAAVFHPGTIAFSWTVPDPEPRNGIATRFKEISEIVHAALQELGIEAHIGELPGEYCPGAYSVNARNRTKIMGVGQRVVRGAAHVGGVIVVNDHASIRNVLLPVYEALDLEWDPRTVGSIEQELGAPRDLERVAETLLDQFDDRFSLREALLPESVLIEAEKLAPAHTAP